MNDNWIKQKIDWLTAKVKNLESGGGGSSSDSHKMDNINPIGIGSFSIGRKKGTSVGLGSFCESGIDSASVVTVKVTYVSSANDKVIVSTNNVYTNFVEANSYIELLDEYRLILDVDKTNKLITVYNPTLDDMSGLSNTTAMVTWIGNTATGVSSHAEGANTSATGSFSHSEGRESQASGAYSHAQNYQTTASGGFSHAQNRGTIAQGSNQTAIGAYNVADTTSALIIGGGTGGSSRKNIMTVDWEGNILANSFNGMKVTSGNIDSGYGTTLTLESGGQYMMIVTIWNASGAIYANGFYFISVPSGNSYASANPSYYRYGSYSGYNITLGYSGSFKMVKSYTDYSGQYSLMKIG